MDGAITRAQSRLDRHVRTERGVCPECREISPCQGLVECHAEFAALRALPRRVSGWVYSGLWGSL